MNRFSMSQLPTSDNVFSRMLRLPAPNLRTAFFLWLLAWTTNGCFCQEWKEAVCNVDFLAVLNERYPRVPPENNAMVALVQATGPLGQPDLFYELLGIPSLNQDDSTNSTLMIQPNVTEEFRYFELWGNPSSSEFADAARTPWTSAEHPEVHVWLVRNTTALQWTLQASYKNDYYCPWVIQTDESLVFVRQPQLSQLYQLGLALKIRAMRSIGESSRDQAWQDLLALYRLSRLLQQGPTILEHRIGAKLEDLAINGILGFLRSNPADGKLALYQRDLDASPPRLPLAEKVDIAERISALDALCKLSTGKLDLRVLLATMELERDFTEVPLEEIQKCLDWKLARDRINEFYDASVESLANDKVNNLPLKADQMLDRSSESTIRLLKSPAAVKNLKIEELTELMLPWLIETLSIPPTKLKDELLHLEQKDRHLRLGFELSRKRFEQGFYPESLDGFNAEGQSDMTVDRFTNSKIRYERTMGGCRFYSCGSNGIDEMGLGDDILVELGQAN